MLTWTVKAEGVSNVALGKPVHQSSTSRWSKPAEPEGVVDGIRTGTFSFHTGFEENPWLEIDLLTEYPLNAVVIYNRDDAYAKNTKNLCLSISIDRKNWVDIFSFSAVFGGILTGQPLIIPIRESHVARYVKIYCKNQGYLHLDEVEIFVEDSIVFLKSFCEDTSADLSYAVGTRKLPDGTNDEYRIINPSKEYARSSITGIKMRRFGQFGNNIIQIINVIIFAKKVGIEKIYVDDLKNLHLPPEIDISGIKFISGNVPSNETLLNGAFFYRIAFKNIYGEITPKALYEVSAVFFGDLFQDFIRRSLTPDPDVLHIHIRSGDVFVGNGAHPLYVQPPLSYYKMCIQDAISRLGIKSFVLIFQDFGNPCIRPLMDYLEAHALPYRVRSGSFNDDLIEMISARHIVSSFGTLIPMVGLISKNIETLYIYRMPISKFRSEFDDALAFKLKARIYVRDNIDSYIKMGEWKNTEDQRNLMLSYPAEFLSLE